MKKKKQVDGRRFNGRKNGEGRTVLAKEYIDAFNLGGSYEEAGKILGIHSTAIRMWFQRNGYKVVKIIMKEEKS